MRTAAGVLLIIAALFNLFASLFYLGLGGAGKLSAMAAEQSRREGHEPPPEAEQNAERLNTVHKQLGTTGNRLMAFGAFLLVTVGTSIAGAVCLFRARAWQFVIVAAALALIAEVIGVILLKFGWTNIPGGVGAIFAVLGARQIRAMLRPAEPVPPPAGATT